jgi:hypothetical protein
MRAIAIAILLVVAGCGHANVNARSDARAVNSNASVQVHAGNSFAALVLAGMLIAGAVEDIRNPQPFPSLSVFSDWMNPSPAPAMQPDRAISDQDCTKPIELGDNLRCR